MTDIDLERELYVEEVLRWIPSDVSDREEIAMEIRSLIAERVAAGERLESVLTELGTPFELAESYMVDEPMENAPNGARFGAKMVDFVVMFAAVVFTGFLSDRRWSFDSNMAGMFLFGGLAMCLVVAYPIYSELRWGQTIGKYLFKIRVVRESGTQVSLGQAIVRQLAMYFQVIFFDALFIFFNPRRQRATEMLSHTRTIKVR